MFPHILSKEQQSLITLLSQFKREYYLVGGTAIALQIGHRKSIDFDLFKKGAIRKMQIKKKITESSLKIDKVLYEDTDQLHILIKGVKITFFQYPYAVSCPIGWDNIIKMPTLLDLAAMKAYALGKRAKWKDYVDLYFLLKEYHSYFEVVDRAYQIFSEDFSEKLFREQLCYFEDVNYDEKVEYCTEIVPDEVIKDFLTNISTDRF